MGIKATRDNLLALHDGWGDNEANKAFSPAFIDEVLSFKERIVSSLAVGGYKIFEPVIAPCDGNSIDIHWKNDDFQVLINIDETSRNVGFFGKKASTGFETDHSDAIIDIMPFVIDTITFLMFGNHNRK
jgi:hypothetical protein